MERVTALLSSKAAAYAGGAAIAGGVGRWILDGDYRLIALIQKIVGGIVGVCFVVSSTIVFPVLVDHVYALIGLSVISGMCVEPILRNIFWRIENADVTVHFGGIRIESEGRDNHDTGRN